MPRYRDALPQLSNEVFLTDGGLETTLLYQDGIDLAGFAAYALLDEEHGRARLARHFEAYARLARESGVGSVLDTPTWRANADWGREIGHSAEALVEANRRSVELLTGIRDELGDGPPLVVSGCIGPRADGYRPGALMSAEEARDYHRVQLATFAATEADLASAFTLNYTDEAVGIVLAARDVSIPIVISFTLETDGRLPTGEGLGAAIQAVDAATDGGPAYYMINCAHPTHFDAVLQRDEPWIGRLRGLRVNASMRSHAELDASEELDSGNPEELGGQVAALRAQVEHLNVLGGCCGTDPRHVAAIARACLGQSGHKR